MLLWVETSADEQNDKERPPIKKLMRAVRKYQDIYKRYLLQEFVKNGLRNGRINFGTESGILGSYI